MDIAANVDAFLGERDETGRESSFDYCFNYFADHRTLGGNSTFADSENLQMSCLQLGFYLASWGMMRGSAYLSRRSLRYFVPVIEAIAEADTGIWTVDADDYNDDACDVLLATARQIRSSLESHYASDTLVTKIMLGVFGCVPALDTYFNKGLGVRRLNRESLRAIADFYASYAEAIDSQDVPTISFETGEPTNRRYTKAKIIDMAVFVAGAG
jgi:hypothetical protein